MSKIRILDPNVANQIAAGEVVERPASALKELLENALDAGATRLTATMEAGGKQLLRLEDDGEGMDRDDALMAIERHATSKLGASADLGAIRSLGFRGEALPSIAAVSRFVLISREAGSETGTRVEVEGGTLRRAEEVGAPVGTLVEVRSLFFNMPARRKFLKTTQTEISHCLRVLEEAALSRPELRIEATHGGRPALELSPAADRMERILSLYGGEAADWVHRLEERPGIRLEVYAGLRASGPSRGRRFLFWVNGRPVQDRGLIHAVRQAWEQQKGVEAPGLTLAFLDLPPEQVDVNIHPAKAEVRLRGASRVHDFLRDVLAAALRSAGAFPPAPLASLGGAARRSLGEGGPDLQSYQERIAEAVDSWSDRAGAAPELGGPPSHPYAPAGLRGATAGAEEPAEPVPLAQYDESYILAQDDEGLLIVDQHVAHERVLYERILRNLESGRPERQGLLVPITLEVPPHMARLIEERLEVVEALGFEVEPFGGTTFVVKAAPPDLPGSQVEEALAAVFEEVEEGGDRDRRTEAAAATLACHAAIKVNTPLTPMKMRWLLGEWWKCDSPMVCPHGRPVVLRLSHLDLERAFLRK